MPAITKVDTVSTTLPMWYFYCNFRYRFWENRFPKLLFKGSEYDDHEVFHRGLLEEFDALGLL